MWLLWKHEWYFRHDPKLDEKFAYVKDQLKRLRHEQWLKRRSTRGAEKTYFADPVDEGAELRMERRGIAVRDIVERATARRIAERGLAEDARVRDHWVERPPTNLADTLELRRLVPVQLRVHPEGRAHTWKASTYLEGEHQRGEAPGPERPDPGYDA